jgi:hypothetical protein
MSILSRIQKKYKIESFQSGSWKPEKEKNERGLEKAIDDFILSLRKNGIGIDEPLDGDETKDIADLVLKALDQWQDNT